jgi:5-methylcytosine-specific restriction endonuclease McrA
MNNRKVICAGCQNQFLTIRTTKYRKKRCCGSDDCFKIIDQKVTNFNYKKQQKKLANGTFRHGVPIEIKKQIIERDKNICQHCKNICAEHKAQVHHITPVSAGGLDEHKNLILLCSDCHTDIHKNDWKFYVTDFKKYTSGAPDWDSKSMY